jgi:hypothetical protein
LIRIILVDLGESELGSLELKQLVIRKLLAFVGSDYFFAMLLRPFSPGEASRGVIDGWLPESASEQNVW